MSKLSHKDQNSGEFRGNSDSAGRSVHRGSSRSRFFGNQKIVISGKKFAPVIGNAAGPRADDALVGLALEGRDPQEIARIVGVRAAELTIRLVELRTGPLGCIRPAAEDPVSGLFADVPLRRSRRHVPVKQKPVLSLVARAFGHRLQRLGDRLYLGGEEITLPTLVRLARERGVRIRYPRLDPMEGAWNTGPSRGARRVADASRPWWLQ